MGQVRLTVDAHRHRALKRLFGQTVTTANHLADNMDDLSNFLGAEDQDRVAEITDRLAEMTIPRTYREVVSAGHEGIRLYQGLLDRIDEREQFELDRS